jgi:hypothetical protein
VSIIRLISPEAPGGLLLLKNFVFQRRNQNPADR